jgi:hypothetical protein
MNPHESVGSGEGDNQGSASASVDHEPRRERIGRQARSVEAAAIAGVVYAVLTVAGLTLLSRYPSFDQPEAEITDWFDDPAHRSTLILGLNLVVMASVAFLWFVGVVRRRLGHHEDQFFGTVFFGSGIVSVAISLAGGAALAAPAVAGTILDSNAVDEASASLAAGLGAGLLLSIAPRFQAVFVITTSTVILRSGFLPRWLGFVGYLIGLGMFALPLITRPVGIAFPVWVLVVSVVIFVRRPDSGGAADGSSEETAAADGSPQS